MLFNSHLGNKEVNDIFLLYEFIKIPNMLVLMHAYNIQLKYKILNPVSWLLINYVLMWY